MTGLARTFWHLLLARVAVGIGEAGCSPPAYSLISDYFEPKRRATAISIYSLGVSGGAIVGLLVGRRLAELMGGGLLLRARSAGRGARDRRRGHVARAASRLVRSAWCRTSQPAPLGTVVAALWAKRSFRSLSLAAALHAFVAYGVAGFYSAFLIRSHDMGLAQAGRWLAFATIAGGLAGTFLGGKLADVLTNRTGDARWRLRLPAITLLLDLPVGVALYLSSDVRLVILFLTLNIALGSVYLAPTVATTQRLVGLRERALAASFLFFLLNLIGLGLGPIATGHVSDTLREYFLDRGIGAAAAVGEGLRFAMLLMLAANFASAILYLRAARTIRGDLVS